MAHAIRRGDDVLVGGVGQDFTDAVAKRVVTQRDGTGRQDSVPKLHEPDGVDPGKNNAVPLGRRHIGKVTGRPVRVPIPSSHGKVLSS